MRIRFDYISIPGRLRNKRFLHRLLRGHDCEEACEASLFALPISSRPQPLIEAGGLVRDMRCVNPVAHWGGEGEKVASPVTQTRCGFI